MNKTKKKSKSKSKSKSKNKQSRIKKNIKKRFSRIKGGASAHAAAEESNNEAIRRAANTILDIAKGVHSSKRVMTKKPALSSNAFEGVLRFLPATNLSTIKYVNKELRGKVNGIVRKIKPKPQFIRRQILQGNAVQQILHPGCVPDAGREAREQEPLQPHGRPTHRTRRRFLRGRVCV